jgi:hypothetical protein
MFKEAIQSKQRATIIPLFTNDGEKNGFKKPEIEDSGNGYKTLYVKNYWHSVDHNYEPKNSKTTDRGQLVGFSTLEKENRLVENQKKGIEKRKPVKVKYSQWNVDMGDFFIIDEEPNFSFNLRREIKKIKKSKYILASFILGTVIVISIVSTLLTKF